MGKTNIEKTQEEVDIDDIINEMTEDIEMDDDVVDDVVDETIDNQLANANPSDLGIDLEEKNSLANKIAENSLSVIDNAKEVYKGFKDDVLFGRDRSTSSKEMLVKSLEVQNQANKNLIDLAKVLKAESSGNTNILIASQVSEKKSGVNSSNIRSHFKK